MMQRLKRRWGMLGVVVIAGTFGWLMFGGLDSNIVYFLTPGELLARVRRRWMYRCGSADR